MSSSCDCMIMTSFITCSKKHRLNNKHNVGLRLGLVWLVACLSWLLPKQYLPIKKTHPSIFRVRISGIMKCCEIVYFDLFSSHKCWDTA